MPDMIDILDHRRNLVQMADDLYRKIEIYYQMDDRGRVYYSPMNVSMDHQGYSDRPGGPVCQGNAFLIARRCIKILHMTEPDVKQLKTLILFFLQEFRKLSESSVGDLPLPDQFIDPLQNMTASLVELERLMNEFNSQPFSTAVQEIELYTFFKRQVEFLIKEGFDPYIVNKVCVDLITQKSNGKYQETKKPVSFDFDMLRKLGNRFKPCMLRKFNGRLDLDNSLADTPLTDDEKYVGLRKILKNETVELITAFNACFGQFHYETHQAKVIAASKNPNLFWSKEQRAHHKRFEETLGRIQQRLIQ